MWRFLAVLLLATGHARAGVVVHLKDEATVQDNVVSIGDVARVSCECDAHDIEDLSLGYAPRVGYSRSISAGEVVRRIRKTGYSATLEGAERTVVHREGRQLAGKLLQGEAQEILEQWLSKHGFLEWSVKSLSKLKAVSLPKGHVDIEYQVSVPARGRTVRVLADISVDGEHYQTYPIWFRVTAKRRTYMADRMIPRGVGLKNNVSLSEVEVKHVGGEYPGEDIASMRAKLPLERGQVIMRADVEPVPAVQTGAVTDVRSTVGNVTIHTKAVAMDDGNVGQVVRLRSPESGQVYRGRVLRRGFVIATGGLE